MPYRWVNPTVFYRYKGIKIYYAYNDGWENDPYQNIYTTDVLENTGDDGDYEFDVRELKSPIIISDNRASHKEAIRWAIKNKKLELPEGVSYER